METDLVSKTLSLLRKHYMMDKIQTHDSFKCSFKGLGSSFSKHATHYSIVRTVLALELPPAVAHRVKGK
jgi:hypothetical protein